MILVIGDLHFKDKLGYHDYVNGGRDSEKEEILNFIVETSKDCNTVIFLGDLLNSRSNSPHVIRQLVNFIERFSDKEIYIISGNHESFSDGRSALDFLGEVKNPKWHIITKDIQTLFCYKNMTFLPWFTKSQRETSSNEDFIKGIMDELPGGDILFHHFAVSDTLVNSGISVETFTEPIFSRKELESKYKLVIGGHIHHPSVKGKTVVSGSIFNNEVGEKGKYVWTVDDDLKVKQIKIPGRGIYKLENPTDEELDKIEAGSIVKVILTEKLPRTKVEELKEKLSKFDAFLVSEQVPHERKRMNYGNGEAVTEFSIEQLLEIYAKERSIDLEKLKLGFELIR